MIHTTVYKIETDGKYTYFHERNTIGKSIYYRTVKTKKDALGRNRIYYKDMITGGVYDGKGNTSYISDHEWLKEIGAEQ